MTDDYAPPLDALAEALRVLDVGHTYGFDTAASYQAALHVLRELDAEQARQAAAALAAQVSRWVLLCSIAPGGQRTLPLDMWVRYSRCVAGAGREEP